MPAGRAAINLANFASVGHMESGIFVSFLNSTEAARADAIAQWVGIDLGHFIF
jgi:hypothetical protein